MKKYVFISGGELFNKGAQAMTFIAVDQMKRRFPDAEIVLLSTSDYKRSEEDKSHYNFTILPFSTGWIYDYVGGALGTVYSLKNMVKKPSKDKFSTEKETIGRMLNDVVAWIDISGYALSSQFASNRSLDFLLRILTAKRHNIKMAIMPQSFGPFAYEGKNKYLFDYLMKKTLPYPVRIYAREQEGYDLLTKERKLQNVERTYDMVLMNKELNLKNIYTEVPDFPTYEDVESAIGVVPNEENFKRADNEEVYAAYKYAIDTALEHGRKVYLLRHSQNDQQVCLDIKNMFKDNEAVILLDRDISSLEFDNLVEKLDFVIGSRFHSIVHSYKNHVPCIAIGWATKYHELLKLFNQYDYIFDVREDLDKDKLNAAVVKLLNNYQEESQVIGEKLVEVQNSTNLFKVF
ncbi:colanic acid/amylovoran biosynthesis protein [Alkalibacterium subtropicum]|uniref:Colanic acid/amylovoran biosynthesis protein n=1 Tax=Alkalibacterium subtropicum TaxID=753702 RepID=A0A1I1GPH5_9LACT|nr:polysaccharide pyruvyl transferase family protein [Alkalibacterium subtropicum]SFC11163.1 colanic acid/amylovoran biosynthesis protein [Alkalibacterium subtropicum]